MQKVTTNLQLNENQDLLAKVKIFFWAKKVSSFSKKPRLHKRLKERLLSLTFDDGFIESVKKFRNEFGIPYDGHTAANQALKLAQTIQAKNSDKYDQSLKDIFKLFDIYHRWHSIVEYYIWCNDFEAHDLYPQNIQVEIFVHPEINEPGIFLQIYSDNITKKDLTDYLEVIKIHQAVFKTVLYENDSNNTQLINNVQKIINSKPRASSEKKIRSQKQMSDLKQQNKSYKEIRGIIENIKNPRGKGNVGTELNRFRKRKKRNPLY